MRDEDQVRLRHMVEAAQSAMKFETSVQVVWETVTVEIPAVLPLLQALVARR